MMADGCRYLYLYLQLLRVYTNQNNIAEGYCLGKTEGEMTDFVKYTPLGCLKIELTDNKLSGCRWMNEDGVKEVVSDERIETTEILSEIIGQLDDYFCGSLKAFDVPLFLEGTEFEKKVWNELLKISYGETVTYKEIAIRIGRPGAVRAVGMACKRNPVGVYVPCHRVVSAGGKPGGYNGGVERKLALLEMEYNNLLANKHICLPKLNKPFPIP